MALADRQVLLETRELADLRARLERYLLLLDPRVRQGHRDLAALQVLLEMLLLFQDRPAVQDPPEHLVLQGLRVQRERALIFL